jgi:hypothetical membrane protein
MGIDISFGVFKRISRLACIITIFGVLQFFLLTFLAAFFYPGGYDYFGYYFSDLGAVVARNGDPNLISRILFFVALTLLALALIPFWLTIRSLFTEPGKEKILSTIGSTLGVISSPFLIGIGLFPLDTQLETHFLVTLIFVLLFLLATLFYSITIILNQNYSNYFGIIGFVLFAIPIASFTISFMDPFDPVGAFLQKIALYGYFIWVLLPIYLIWPLVRLENWQTL